MAEGGGKITGLTSKPTTLACQINIMLTPNSIGGNKFSNLLSF